MSTASVSIDEMSLERAHLMLARRPILSALARSGWAQHTISDHDLCAVSAEIQTLGFLLGTQTFGRGRAFEEYVRPQASFAAHPRSLSAQYGYDALPFHVELSHRPRPCRYVLFGCIDPGLPTTITKLLSWSDLTLTRDELKRLEDAPLLVRNGRWSFYSNILSPDRTFPRYDPGCMEAVDERGRDALRLMEDRLKFGSPVIHEWCRGSILIIDNWRVLHGRGPSLPSSDRTLLRILIDA